MLKSRGNIGKITMKKIIMSIMLAAAFMPLHGMVQVFFTRVGNSSQPEHTIERFIPKEGVRGGYAAEGIAYCLKGMDLLMVEVNYNDIIRVTTSVCVFDFYNSENQSRTSQGLIKILPGTGPRLYLLSEDSVEPCNVRIGTEPK